MKTVVLLFTRHRLLLAALCSLSAVGIATRIFAASPRWTGICSRCAHFWVQWVEPAASKTACEKIKNGSWCYGTINWERDDGKKDR
jgi:hypothetical protein